MYNPDKWSIIKVKTESETFYKVFATWSGGYLDGDSWRMNSGIEEVTKDGEYYEFAGASGSVYRCHEEMYGTNMYGAGVMKSMLDKYPDMLEVIQEDDWKKELKTE